ncbi:MAG TPA: hypothetical protein VGI19_02565 [Candidatus Cybelea sp.]
MRITNASRYAFSIGAAVVLLAGCSGGSRRLLRPARRIGRSRTRLALPAAAAASGKRNATS